MHTIHSEIRKYTPAVALDGILSRRTRRNIMRVLAGVLVVLGGVVLSFVVRDSLPTFTLNFESVFTDARVYTASFLVLLGIFLTFLQLSFFYNSLYYRGLAVVLKEDFTDDVGVTQEVAAVCLRGKDDLTRGFLSSSYGEEIMIRSGIELGEVASYLASLRPRIHPEMLKLKEGTFLTLEDVGLYLYENDHSLKDFLFAHGVTEALFRGANEWVWRVRALYKNRQRWWGRDNLGRITGIGREFSYGTAFNLKRYQRDINTTSAFSIFLRDTAYANEIIARIETTLTRSKAANVLLVGEAGVGKMDMLIELGRRMREGESVASLGAKRLVVFDADVFVAEHNSKESFEAAFLNLMAETERAGNIIVVIEDITAFLRSVSVVGVDAAGLLDQFLTSSEVQLVATADPQSYHRSLEGNQSLLQYFEPILIETPDNASTVRVLEEASWGHEHRHNVYFTYPALVRIADSANQYIIDGVMPDKAVSLLAEVAAAAGQAKLLVVSPEFVDACVRQKTGIPVGPLSDTERDTLVHLEEILHERVVGQHRAIEAVAGAMRRARAGIQSKERPIGSFLFLGSTGVGKTETAKALAHTFFGSEESMVRLDMSEFSDASGLSRLLGSETTPGVLASSLREHPYCVLLLDEFEKSAESVHDLFLQIFDEGMFTDGKGMRVNARNTIIIATSNAGSDLIWEFLKEGKHPQDERDQIVDAIIARHIFKPELLNRFDAVILFETLGADEQRHIATLMLDDLHRRIREQGYELIVDDVLINVLMKVGYDPQFGARPMRRAIQDVVEERIAKKIIAGGLKAGDTIHFSVQDFPEYLGATAS